VFYATLLGREPLGIFAGDDCIAAIGVEDVSIRHSGIWPGFRGEQELLPLQGFARCSKDEPVLLILAELNEALEDSHESSKSGSDPALFVAQGRNGNNRDGSGEDNLHTLQQNKASAIAVRPLPIPLALLCQLLKNRTCGRHAESPSRHTIVGLNEASPVKNNLAGLSSDHCVKTLLEIGIRESMSNNRLNIDAGLEHD